MRLAVIVIALALAGAARAAAQPAPDSVDVQTGFIGQQKVALEIDDCPVKPELAADKLRARASEHYQRGEVLYVQGDYRGAVSELISSYCLIPYFSVLKDVGQAYERQLDYPRAIAYLGRYLQDIPQDAKQAAACGVDPQADRATVSARIQVLADLPARILVDTQPAGAHVTLTSEGGVTARATSGEPIEVRGGRYQLVIELAGFHRVARPIAFEIGKPYTLFEQLKPIEGHLRVQAVPNDARIFIDNRFVGVGRYEASLPAADYSLSAEAEGHVTLVRKVTVLADRERDETLDLPGVKQTGRRQLLVYTSIAGASVGGALLSGFDNSTLSGIGVLGGLAGGLVGGYFAIPGDQPLGTSSLTITASLGGAVAGGAISQLISSKNDILETLVGAGALVGGTVGYLAGSSGDVSPGDAALINSGLLWGGVTGTLFTITFNTTGKVSGGLLLGGLAMGGTGSALIARSLPISRVHAALIDVAGIAGTLGGLAVESLAYQNTSSSTASVVVRERLANFALGGMAVGLIVGGVLTRNIDSPKLAITPTVGGATARDGKTAVTYGLAGEF